MQVSPALRVRQKTPRKIFIAEVGKMQDERHGKLGAKAKVEQEKNAAQTHKAVSAALLDADSE